MKNTSKTAGHAPKDLSAPEREDSDNETPSRKVVVVLGMHRSGTSAVTRALQALGIDLGEHLMPAISDNNEKGFFEDIEINKLNIELLDLLGSDWDDLSLTKVDSTVSGKIVALRLHAIELLRNRIQDGPYGMKDPRIGRLIFFWREVFEHLKIEPVYIITVRHPMSVAQSLKKRDGFETEKSYYLWLEHILPAILDTTGNTRIAIDYELLMSDPTGQLERLAQRLELPFDKNSPAANEFTEKFLDQGLQHHRFKLEDLMINPEVPESVVTTYKLLLNLSRDKTLIDDPDITDTLIHIRANLESLFPAFSYIRHLETEDVASKKMSVSLQQQVEHCEEQIGNLRNSITARDNQLNQLINTISNRDAHIKNLENIQVELKKQIETINQVVTERNSDIDSLKKGINERESDIDSLKKGINERENQIAGLEHSLASHSTQISNLSDAVSGRDRLITSIYHSNSWRITRPLRSISTLLAKLRGGQQSQETEISTPAPLEPVATTGNQPVIGLPADFDDEAYLKLNPDVAKAGISPVTHYLNSGHETGRVYSFPKYEFKPGSGFKAGRETVLVVSHDASRTGAPILSLNLVQQLKERYNVVALLMGDGDLTTAYRLTGAAVLQPANLRSNAVLANDFIDKLCKFFTLKFALVNSIESRSVLQPLDYNQVPTISLIHEFASYTRPSSAFREALYWSGEVVFSASVTLDNAHHELPFLSDRKAHILPQGRCALPLEEFSEDQLATEKEKLRLQMRPADTPDGTLIVLGAGSVQIRKGIDLFIECANRVVQSSEQTPFRFIWIGNGYNPDTDSGYSVYLADQIRRAGLENHISIINETAAIETAYEEADMLLLSSRLDPLPNVAIDAMTYKLPVLCFDKTTGIADFLKTAKLESYCVAEYLNTEDMARKILALAKSPALYKQVADQCLEASRSYFNMETYISHLEKLAQDASKYRYQETADVKTILDSGLFRNDFSPAPDMNMKSADEKVRCYVRGWASGINKRKPFPGFHPGIYLEEHGVKIPGSDPLADYIQAGQPDGPWHFPLIDTTAVLSIPESKRTALHLHVYYPDLLSEIMSRLSNNQLTPDLFISINNEEARDQVKNILKSYEGRIADIQVVPNKGRDIGPLMTLFGTQILKDYDYFGHIHTKKSVDLKNSESARNWYLFLLENLLGNESNAMMDHIVTYLDNNAAVGMVFPDDPHIVGWNNNRTIAEPLATKIGIDKLPECFNFPVGTMFWARTSLLEPFLSLALDWDDYPVEPLSYDGTLLHTLERLLPLSLESGKMYCAVTNITGQTR